MPAPIGSEGAAATVSPCRLHGAAAVPLLCAKKCYVMGALSDGRIAVDIQGNFSRHGCVCMLWCCRSCMPALPRSIRHPAPVVPSCSLLTSRSMATCLPSSWRVRRDFLSWREPCSALVCPPVTTRSPLPALSFRAHLIRTLQELPRLNFQFVPPSTSPCAPQLSPLLLLLLLLTTSPIIR